MYLHKKHKYKCSNLCKVSNCTYNCWISINHKSSFSDNKNVAFIKVVLKFQTIYYMIIYVSLINVNVSSNECYINNNLILIANGLLQLQSVCFIQNVCYDNIIAIFTVIYKRV